MNDKVLEENNLEYKLIDYFPVVGLVTGGMRNRDKIVASDTDYSRFTKYILSHFVTTLPVLVYALNKVLY